MRKIMVAGNWKLNGSQSSLRQWIAEFERANPPLYAVDVALCVPYVYISLFKSLTSVDIICGAQDLSEHSQGAHTGEISASMLSDVGAQLVLVGHSERRQDYGEDNTILRSKFKQALDNGLTPVLCVGETQAQREKDETFMVIEHQLSAVIDLLNVDNSSQCMIAYEPVWAIGTGLTASADQAQKVHQFIRSQLASKDVTMARQIRLLYGGSCKSSNAYELFSMPDVDGGLIGGASLTADDFMAICQQASELLDKTQSD